MSIFVNNHVNININIIDLSPYGWELPGNYPYFRKCGNLPLCLENYALFSLPPIFTNNLYTYTLRYIIYL